MQALLYMFAATALALPTADAAQNGSRDIASQTPSDVTIHKELDRLLFADAGGMVLYTYDKDRDTPGTSSCTLERHCSRQWPPLTAPADAVTVGEWTIIVRQNGARQWAYDGRPVYTYADDLSAGVASGDNARGGLWHALTHALPPPDPLMPAGFSIQKSSVGWVFADHAGRVLHISALDEVAGATACDSACRDRWTPVPAAMLAQTVGNWRPIEGDDKTLQWSWQGRRLYTLRAGEQLAAKDNAGAFQLLRVPGASTASR